MVLDATVIDVAESLNEAVSEEEAHVNSSRHDAADQTYRFSDTVGQSGSSGSGCMKRKRQEIHHFQTL